MKRHGFTLIEALALVAVIAVLAAILFPIFARQREPRRSNCQPNLKQIGLGLIQYVQDYDEKFPGVALCKVPSGSANDWKHYSPYGWADAIQPYLRSTQIYQCSWDDHPRNTNPQASGYTDYWLNSRVAGARQSDFTAIASTILCGEGNDGSDATNARYSYSMLPVSWLTDQNSPLFRHIGGANYLFADGHVKWLKPGQVTSPRPNDKLYTFAVK